MDIRHGSQQSIEWLLAMKDAESYIFDGAIERFISYKWDDLYPAVVAIGLF